MNDSASHFHRRPRRPRSHGMTLVELMLAIAFTAVLGAVVASMLVSVAYGTSSLRDVRSLVVRNKTISGRIGAAISGSYRVLAVDGSTLVLWIDDANNDELPNVSEIRRLEFHADRTCLLSFVADFTGMSAGQIAAADVSYDLTADFLAETEDLKFTDYFPAQTWATSLTDWSPTLNQPQPQQASLVSYRLTVRSGSLTETMAFATALQTEINP